MQSQRIAIRERNGRITKSTLLIRELVASAHDVDILDIVCRVGQVHCTA